MSHSSGKIASATWPPHRLHAWPQSVCGWHWLFCVFLCLQHGCRIASKFALHHTHNHSTTQQPHSLRASSCLCVRSFFHVGVQSPHALTIAWRPPAMISFEDVCWGELSMHRFGHDAFCLNLDAGDIAKPNNKHGLPSLSDLCR